MTTSKRIVIVIATVLMASSLLHCSTTQTTHIVGDDLGWTIPPPGPITYSSWATNQTFMAGDVLVFNFMPGAHDVVQVTKSNYESCNTGNPISAHGNSPAMIRLNNEGVHYFICSFRGHCLAGQKIMIEVVAIVDDATSGAPTPYSIDSPSSTTSASPAPAPAPAPAKSIHSSTAVASSLVDHVALFTTFLSTLFALFTL